MGYAPIPESKQQYTPIPQLYPYGELRGKKDIVELTYCNTEECPLLQYHLISSVLHLQHDLCN
jgi:hypothetical protein